MASWRRSLSQRVRIVLAGAAGWVILGAVLVISLGWRRFAAGTPFSDSWYDAGHHFVILTLGAVLSPVVIAGLGRLRARAQSAFHVAIGFVGLGLLYWGAWSLLRVGYMRAVYPGVAAELAFADHYIRALVFSALVALTIYTAMVLVFEAVWYQGQIRERELEAARLQVALDEARSTALRARVDTDLLGDALARASTMMTRDVQAARTVLVSLSELLRVSFRRSGTGTIPLQAEIELARNIVDIYSSGNQDTPSLDLHVDPRSVGQGVPALVLQPALVGVFRWLRSAGTPSAGRITLHVRPAGEYLVLVLSADCHPSPAMSDHEIRRLENRLQERYRGLAGSRVRRLRDGRLRIRVQLAKADLRQADQRRSVNSLDVTSSRGTGSPNPFPSVV